MKNNDVIGFFFFFFCLVLWEDDECGRENDSNFMINFLFLFFRLELSNLLYTLLLLK